MGGEAQLQSLGLGSDAQQGADANATDLGEEHSTSELRSRWRAKLPEDEQMNQDQLRQVRRQLARERERALRSLSRLTSGAQGPSSSETSGWPPAFEASDQARDAAEEETSLLLTTKEAQLLHQINDALSRLDGEPEAFGYCQRCGVEIPFDRIEAGSGQKVAGIPEKRQHEPTTPSEARPDSEHVVLRIRGGDLKGDPAVGGTRPREPS